MNISSPPTQPVFSNFLVVRDERKSTFQNDCSGRLKDCFVWKWRLTHVKCQENTLIWWIHTTYLITFNPGNSLPPNKKVLFVLVYHFESTPQHGCLWWFFNGIELPLCETPFILWMVFRERFLSISTTHTWINSHLLTTDNEHRTIITIKIKDVKYFKHIWANIMVFSVLHLGGLAPFLCGSHWRRCLWLWHVFWLQITSCASDYL